MDVDVDITLIVMDEAFPEIGSMRSTEEEMVNILYEMVASVTVGWDVNPYMG